MDSRTSTRCSAAAPRTQCRPARLERRAMLVRRRAGAPARQEVRAEERPRRDDEGGLPRLPRRARVRAARTSSASRLCTKCHSSTADGFEGAQLARSPPPAAVTTHSSDKAKLLKASVHDPVAQAGCDSCPRGRRLEAPPVTAAGGSSAPRAARRSPAAGDPARAGEEGRVRRLPRPASASPKLAKLAGNDLCVGCHQAKATVAVPHKAVKADAGCVVPRAALERRGLVKAEAPRSAPSAARAQEAAKRRRSSTTRSAAVLASPAARVELPAHDEGPGRHRLLHVPLGRGEPLHPRTRTPVLDGNCDACSSHASDQPKLLKAAGAKLCQGCHGS